MIARRAIILFQQEIGAQMEVAVFRFVITCGCFDVLDFIFVRQSDAIDALDPRALIVIRIGQVDPDRRRVFKVGPAFDIDLVQAPVLQNEYIDHAALSGRAFRSNTRNARKVGAGYINLLRERGHESGLDAPAHQNCGERR